MNFLGVVIGPERIKMEEEKVKSVLDWPTLKEVKDIQKLSIKYFTVIAKPLHDLVKKD